MDSMFFLHFFQAKNSISRLFAIYFAPDINKVRSVRDSSVLIIQSGNSDLSEAAIATFLLC